jgi:hypothetical protein
MKVAWLQLQWIDATANELITPLVGNFDCVALLMDPDKSEEEQAKVAQVANVAHDNGIGVGLWITPGRWDAYPPGTIPDEWNLLSWIPLIDGCERWVEDHPDWTKEACRGWTVQYWLDYIDSFGDTIDAVFGDYLRYRSRAWIVPKGIVDPSQVTSVVQGLSEGVRARGMIFGASVIQGRARFLNDRYGTWPEYAIKGQGWPTWIRMGLIDYTGMMQYCPPTSIPSHWELVPEDVRIKVTGLSSYDWGADRTPLSREEILECYDVVRSMGGKGLSMFIRHGSFNGAASSGVLDTFGTLPSLPKPPDPPLPDDSWKESVRGTISNLEMYQDSLSAITAYIGDAIESLRDLVEG